MKKRERNLRNERHPQTSREKVYLTKRLLERAVRQGLIAAAAETMRVVGYNVIAEDGWVVKVYADGKKERINRISPVARPAKITLR